jgi:hypothetical protein
VDVARTLDGNISSSALDIASASFVEENKTISPTNKTMMSFPDIVSI